MDESKRVEVVVLAAGFGSRLGGNLPKCLIDVGGRSILEHQIRAIRQVLPESAITVVTGYRHDKVVEHLSRRRLGSVRVLFNPFYQVAGILGSAWVAGGVIQAECVLRLDGDVLFDADLPAALLQAPVTALALAGCQHKEKTAILTNPGAGCPVLGLAENYSGSDEWIRAELYRNGDFQKLIRHAELRPDFTSAYYFEAFNDYVAEAVVPVSVIRVRHGYEINTPDELSAAQSAFQSEPSE